MDQKNFKSWLDLYGRAWKTKNPNLIKKLFTQDATYQEKSFEDPIMGIDSITEYWSLVSQTQENVNFCYDILSVDGNQGIAHWSASFIRRQPQTRIELDGIFVINLNPENKCINFREWWQSKKSPIR